MCGRGDLMELSGNEEVVMCGVTLCVVGVRAWSFLARLIGGCSLSHIYL